MLWLNYWLFTFFYSFSSNYLISFIIFSSSFFGVYENLKLKSFTDSSFIDAGHELAISCLWSPLNDISKSGIYFLISSANIFGVILSPDKLYILLVKFFLSAYKRAIVASKASSMCIKGKAVSGFRYHSYFLFLKA